MPVARLSAHGAARAGLCNGTRPHARNISATTSKVASAGSGTAVTAFAQADGAVEAAPAVVHLE